ncbi:regulation of nuclear pre-mRNA domain-containing protein 2 isoform X2 [Sitodiplosis mosellana]|uniref:regulation of nuclear pre-mRNA domain-containing protein 2 isoform X2 n=1 Tax=Sitodiplosis mosellana TaxID=263140 RepID=UPI002444536A|nr:regulation of nuclear pre-mRNA domain-containing protein 2 isoform X2 [Sitodiplosis mosellana]
MKSEKTMDKSSSKAEFDSAEFEKRLTNLKDTQDSIQALSAWCLQNRSHHKKIVTSWLIVLKQVKVEHRLTLFYLANDVIQYSKRKNYEFVESWGTALQRATTMVREEKVKHKIERIFRIWEQRVIYNEEFLSDLRGLLSINPAKKPPPNENDDEQATITVANIKNCIKLEKETDRSFKALPKASLCDKDTISQLKDRSQVEELEKEVIERRVKLEHYIKTLTNEIKARTALITVLDQADAFYHNQRGEVKVVATAYRNYGNSIKTMKRRLEELTKTLPSPIPSPDINAPSPGPADNDFVLPGEKNFNQNVFNAQTNRMMGYMDGGRLPFDINDFATSSPKTKEAHIQVIDSTSGKDNNEIDDFFKTLMHDTYTPAIPPQPVPAVSGPNYYESAFPSQQTSTYEFTQYENTSGNVSTNLFRGEANNSSYNQSYSGTFNAPIAQPPLPPPPNRQENWEMDMSWNSNQESSFNHTMDAPRSPPHYERKGINTNVIEYIEPGVNDSHIAGAGDVDHRQLILPMNGLNALGAKDRGRLIDVDHRNLISLTGSPKLSEKDANGSQIDSMRNNATDSKLLPPPSPPAMLLSSNISTSDTASQNRSPSKIHNGRDNTESIDMEMSDEDFDTIPDFQNKSVDDLQQSNMEPRSEGLLGPAPNFGSPDCAKRPNPFRSNAQDVLHPLQPPQMLLHSNLPMPRPGPGPRPLLDIPTGFNNARPFLGHHNSLMPDSPTNQPQSPFLLNNPRGMSPHVNQTHSPQMNYRNNNQSTRGNSPYFRNQKGPMRGGGYRPNFRGGGNRNWS